MNGILPALMVAGTRPVASFGVIEMLLQLRRCIPPNNPHSTPWFTRNRLTSPFHHQQSPGGLPAPQGLLDALRMQNNRYILLYGVIVCKAMYSSPFNIAYAIYCSSVASQVESVFLHLRDM